MKIYSLLLVKNEADVITASLVDACRWSDKIIVIDNGSTDGTWEMIQSLAQTHPQIVPWMQYTGPFHIGLRAKAFRAFRKELTANDWWCVRLDADEFFPGDVRGFLAGVPKQYRTVKKYSTDYILTRDDVAQYTFTGDFAKDRKYITHALPVHRQERRFMRHSPWLVWLERWRYPHPWGRVSPTPIPVDHYQFRSPQQMAKRYATRQQAKADGCGSFSHERGASWEDYLDLLHVGRNIVRVVDDKVVKEFHAPRFPNSLIYGLFRKSKARRSFEYAQELGDLTPKPVSYHEVRKNGLLRESYYVSERSALPLTLREYLRSDRDRDTVLRTLGRFTALLHQKGFWPLDFTAGNFLVSEDGTKMQMVDLNRMKHVSHLTPKQARKQFDKLPLTPEDINIILTAYEQV